MTFYLFAPGANRAMTLAALLGLLPFLPNTLLATEPQVQSLKDGIALNIADGRVELRVATPHAFRLHFISAAGATRGSSIFLSGVAQPAIPFTVVHPGASMVGIKTDFGQLLVDASRQEWSLLDGRGAILADWAPYRTIVSGTDADSRFHFEMGPFAGKSRPLYYGSGNEPNRGSITQPEAASKTGNGSTALPQYWSTSGYGALMITANDNKPASWHAGDLGDVTWTVPGPNADLYLAPAADLYAWSRDQAELTGFAPIPPLWAFGYLQCRWGWKDKAYIDDTLARFHHDNLPVDAFIFDFEWYTTTPDYEVTAPGRADFVDFGWNPALLPDPAGQIADFLKQGLHIVGIRKPRLGNADDLTMARSKGWILPSNPDDPNSDNIKTRNLNFSNPDAQAYWHENNRKFLEAGMAGFWNDEGETTFTEYSYWNLTEVNLFKQVNPTARFWSLNRSFAPGMQRFGAAAWTGDINSSWDELAQTPGDLLSYSLSGMPYSACDIGGFSGEASPELMTRWMEAGVFFPIQRSHSYVGNTPRFPWLYGAEAENAIRKALDLRYQLIPYYYSLAFETHLTGAPLMRPLIMEFPHEDRLSDVTDEWLMGKGLLVGPILHQGGERDVYLPKDESWFDFATNQPLPGGQLIHQKKALDEIPIYVRAGTLLPLGPVVQNTIQTSPDPLELRIYPGHDASFNFVQDDGTTLNYEKGARRLVVFSWNDQTKTLSWKVSGNYRGANIFHQIKAVLISSPSPAEKPASLDGDGSIVFN